MTTIGELAQKTGDYCPGLYVIVTPGRVLYVGQSKRCARRRANDHWLGWDISRVGQLVRDFAPASSAWEVIIVPTTALTVSLDEAEQRFIQVLRPSLNITHAPDDTPPLPARRSAAAQSSATFPGAHKGRTPANAGRTYPIQILTTDEARRLLAAPSARAPTGIRIRALLAVLYRAGLKAAEALALEERDLDEIQGTVSVRHWKGARHRTVSMDPAAFGLVRLWLDRRAALGIRGGKVFCTLAGQPIKPSYVRTLLPRLAAKAGIDKRVHPHMLRHTFAAELAKEGVPINEIQAQLGHTYPHRTAMYLHRIASTEPMHAIQARNWDAAL
jgi:integrase